jgi:hypothetical protein
MSGRSTRSGFASRPGDAESWIKASEAPPRRADDALAFTARLTIDVTPTPRGDAAFRRGITVADMLHDFPAREFPADPGEPS